MEWSVARPKTMLILLLCHPQVRPLCSNTPSWPSPYLIGPPRDGGRQADASLLLECVRQAHGVGHLGERGIRNRRSRSANWCRSSRRLSGHDDGGAGAAEFGGSSEYV